MATSENAQKYVSLYSIPAVPTAYGCATQHQGDRKWWNYGHDQLPANNMTTL
ncbi:hypothetical protein M404DRAFT_994596, partial [Pisolithus tinctorius Marx 270]